MLDGLSVNFGGVQAVAQVDLNLAPGERHGLIGPNGAGKTTLFNVIAGNVNPAAGTVRLDGRDITRKRPHTRARLGICRTFQITNLFLDLTVMENVLLALRATRFHLSPFKALSRFAALRRAAEDLLDRWGLAGKSGCIVAELPYGAQRKLEMVLALANEPILLLLDEPLTGLSGAEIDEFTAFVQALSRDITLLFIEHDLATTFEIAETVTVMHQGRIITQGDSESIQQDARVADIYIGG